MWRCKEKVRDVMHGSVASSFHYILFFYQMIEKIDPGCIVDWSTWDDTCSMFRQAFVAPSASRNVVQYCQKCVHAHCAQHIRMNIRTRFGKSAEAQFIQLLYALNVDMLTMI
ncbi:hypothetical protein R1sor_020674 [Riccia sorocarpa]|uniref:Transposase n=1 Tax=Riccia sorocarpa TaxID=122646 RepID=A0ABD3GEW5_9MARC